MDVIFGRKPVLDILSAGRGVNKIVIAEGSHGTVITDIIQKAKAQKIIFSFVHRGVLDAISPHTQGVAAYISAQTYMQLENVLTSVSIKDNPLLCIIDGVTDPHNLGAIARSAVAFGVQGIIIPKHNACGITSTVVKASAGAIAHIPVSQVTNITKTIEYLKEQGFWIIGADMKGTPCNHFDFKRPIALVLGGEEGMHRLVQEHCDALVSIPMRTKVDSLNVSCAAAIMLYEIERQKGQP